MLLTLVIRKASCFLSLKFCDHFIAWTDEMYLALLKCLQFILPKWSMKTSSGIAAPCACISLYWLVFLVWSRIRTYFTGVIQNVIALTGVDLKLSSPLMWRYGKVPSYIFFSKIYINNRSTIDLEWKSEKSEPFRQLPAASTCLNDTNLPTSDYCSLISLVCPRLLLSACCVSFKFTKNLHQNN